MKSISKKLLTSTAALVLTMLLFTLTAGAQGITATVNVSTSLNVRSAGNTGAPVIGRLSAGTQVDILNTSNGWYKIIYGTGTGWISGTYVSLGSAAKKALTAVATAKSCLGVPYVYGGASRSGFDCSGLTQYAYAAAGVSLPHSAAQQAAKGTAVARSALRPGDLVFFDTSGGHSTVTHVGIYVGDGQFINAQSGPRQVAYASLSNSYWSSAYLSARRVAS